MIIDEKTYKAMPSRLRELFDKQPNHGSDEVLALFPERASAGHYKEPEGDCQTRQTRPNSNSIFGTRPGDKDGRRRTSQYSGEDGSAARFFYCAKASSADRGDETLQALPLFDMPEDTFRNDHPTVKPVSLMKYLLRLVVPPGGIILDPFLGSGSTLVAASELGLRAIGIDDGERSCEIAAKRIDGVRKKVSG